MTRILQQILSAQMFVAEAHRLSFPLVLCVVVVLTNVLSAVATLAAAG
jgi:hypothetical protein